jgi:hypothetical protein
VGRGRSGNANESRGLKNVPVNENGGLLTILRSLFDEEQKFDKSKEQKRGATLELFGTGLSFIQKILLKGILLQHTADSGRRKIRGKSMGF